MRSRPRFTLAGQFLLLQLSVLVVVLVAAGFVTLQQADSAFRDERGSRMRSAAESLAGTDGVRLGLQDRYPPLLVLATYAEDVRARLGVDAVYLTDADGVVVVGPDPTVEERPVDLGDDSVLRGRSWVGDIDDRGEDSLAAAVPVLADDGAVVGTVLVAEAYPSLAARVERSVPDLLVFLGLGLALGGAGSLALSRLIRRRTRGLEPAEIGALADQREALLHSLREGLVAVADDGRLTVVNDTARELLALAGDVGPGTPLAAAGLQPEVVELLDPGLDRDGDGAGAEVRDALLVLGGRVIVANRTPVRGGGGTGGVVVTLRDHTELLALRSELRERESVTETLRAQTHEFANQLHTISGLLQLEEYDEAATALGTIVRRRAEISDGVRARVEDPQVAALLVAKTSVAAERGLAVDVVNAEPFPRLDPDLAVDVVTVLGNLVDNAVEASVGAARSVAGPSAAGSGVRVRLWWADGAACIEVADSGSGVEDGDRDRIFERGWSTKTPVVGGRGVGLALVRQVCQRRGGDVTLATSQERGGAVFTARLPGGTA
ncbi:ATP-binding protein [Nocardioides zeae]|uniref:histidine kinase n=1 Tax=Nocardioides imazamoxiresistens TaxID=3231893 RepID=A0ABU3PRN9_9ACTN|nr:ATP-binding protein [Nocardioides zeae]MDT9591546.1 ATP-binding protein [Nocardioides zeae]